MAQEVKYLDVTLPHCLAMKGFSNGHLLDK
jgi:hypothetical protein